MGISSGEVSWKEVEQWQPLGNKRPEQIRFIVLCSFFGKEQHFLEPTGLVC